MEKQRGTTKLANGARMARRPVVEPPPALPRSVGAARGGISLPDGSVVVRVGKSPIHGRGVFAVDPITKGTWIGRYEGERTERDSTYVLWVENEERNGQYGVRGRNHLRFVNHSARPNAEFDGEDLYCLRRIRPGEEITVHYGAEWADD